jgi:hypothetical protein
MCYALLVIKFRGAPQPDQTLRIDTQDALDTQLQELSEKDTVSAISVYVRDPARSKKRIEEWKEG